MILPGQNFCLNPVACGPISTVYAIHQSASFGQHQQDQSKPVYNLPALSIVLLRVNW